MAGHPQHGNGWSRIHVWPTSLGPKQPIRGLWTIEESRIHTRGVQEEIRMYAPILLRERRNCILLFSLVLVTSLCSGGKRYSLAFERVQLPAERSIEVPGKGFPWNLSLSYNGDLLSFSGVDIYVFDTRGSKAVATPKGGSNGFLPGDKFFRRRLASVDVYDKNEWTSPSKVIWVKPNKSDPLVGLDPKGPYFSGDGQWFAMSRRKGPLIGRTAFAPVDVELYEVNTGEVRVVAHYARAQVLAVALSHDGSQTALALASADPRVEILDTDTGAVEEVFRFNRESKFTGGRLRFSPNGAWLAGVAYDRKFRLWKLGEDSPGPRLQLNCGSWCTTVFSPSSNHLVVDCKLQKSLLIWSLPDRESAQEPSLVQKIQTSLVLNRGGIAISGDGQYLAASIDRGESPGARFAIDVVPFEKLLSLSSPVDETQ